METRKQILTELLEIAPFIGRAGFSRIPYTLPAGYFEGFTEILMMRIHLEAAGFSEITGKEITEISTLLAGLQKKNPYQVPVGFFESLDVKIPEVDVSFSGSASTPSKLVTIPSFISQAKSSASQIKRVSMPMRLIRYATAACIVALLGIVAFNLSYNRNIIDPIKGLTTVSNQDMANYLDAGDIHWTPGISTSTETASVEFTDNDIHDLLSGIPDNELEQYSPALPVKKGTVN